MIATAAQAQLQTSNWIFGFNAGLSIQQDSIEVLQNVQLNTSGGSSAISDTNGNLLLYSDGKKVWDGNHQLAENGTGLSGGDGINPNCVFVPHPGNQHLIFLFTINSDSSAGLKYNLIDISGEKAILVEKNIFVTKSGQDRLAAVHHCNGDDYWLVVHSQDSLNFEAFLIDRDGISDGPVISPSPLSDVNNLGPLKFSPDGSRLIVPVNIGNILAAVYKFDNQSGKLAPLSNIYRKPYTYVCGLSFSPSGHFLYLTTGGSYYELLQYDLSAIPEDELNQSKTLISSGNLYGLQLAIDGCIYISKMNSSYLDRIENPEEKGTKCSYQEKAVYLDQGVGQVHLPIFVQSYFYKPYFSVDGTCVGDTTTFTPAIINPYDSVKWSMVHPDHSNTIFSNSFQSQLNLDGSGQYSIKLKVYRCAQTDSLIRQIRIFEPPHSPGISDTSFFSGSEIILSLDQTYDSVKWNGYQSEKFVVSKAGEYRVEVFKNGCTSSGSFIVKETSLPFSIPSAFTPNGDGINDVFSVLSSTNFDNFELYVYNRQGLLIYHGASHGEGWDGSYRNKICPTGTYVWIVKYALPSGENSLTECKTGTFLLLR